MSTPAAEYTAKAIVEFRAGEGGVGRDLAKYARKTDRVIPVVVLTPLGGA